MEPAGDAWPIDSFAPAGRPRPAPVTPTGPESPVADGDSVDGGGGCCGAQQAGFGSTAAAIDASPIPVRKHHRHDDDDDNRLEMVMPVVAVVGAAAAAAAAGVKRKTCSEEEDEEVVEGKPAAVLAPGDESHVVGNAAAVSGAATAEVAFSQELCSLGSVADGGVGGRHGRHRDCDGRASKIARVTPSPLTLPEDEAGEVVSQVSRREWLDLLEPPSSPQQHQRTQRPAPGVNSPAVQSEGMVRRGGEKADGDGKVGVEGVFGVESALRSGSPGSLATSSFTPISFTLDERGE